MWESMFVAGVPLLERVIRATLIYIFALLALRVAGKRELGQFSTFDLVVLLFFSNVLQNSIIGPDNSVTGGIVGALTMLGLNRLSALATFHWAKVRQFLDGRPTYLVAGGALLQRNLHNELISVDELMIAAHKNQVFALSDIEDAILETDGSITILDKGPTIDERHDDTIQRLDELRSAINRLEASLGGREAPSPA